MLGGRAGDFPDTYTVPVRLPRVAVILRRIAFDIDELARARRVEDLQVAQAADDPRAERRRRLAEPALSYAEFCDRTATPWRSTRQGDLAWTAYQAERRRRGETEEDPYTAYNPFRQGRPCRRATTPPSAVVRPGRPPPQPVTSRRPRP